jgi:hypothetical protein
VARDEGESPDYEGGVPEGFPQGLSDAGVVLPTTEVAWRWAEAIEAIEWLAERGFAILGGDVYVSVGEDFKPARDDWYLDKDKAITWESYVLKSAEKAVSYVTWYKGKFGDGFYYVLVWASEQQHSRLVSRRDSRGSR